MTNKEILFVIRMRNEARQAVRELQADLAALRGVATAAAHQLTDVAVAMEFVGKEAASATPRVNTFNAAIAKSGNHFRESKTHADGFFSSIKTGSGHMLGFMSVVGAMEVGLGSIHKYFDFSTDYQNLEGKLKLVTKSDEERAAVRDALFKQAMTTHQDIDSTGEAFYKGKAALGKFGYNDQQILDLSQVINQANLISHASPQAAKYGSYELMQGIGAGQMNGRELRFVAQDSIRLATALADGLTKTAPQLAEQYGHIIKEGAQKGMKMLTAGDLKALASAGELTGTQVATALISQKDKLAQEALNVPLTLPRVKNDLHTSLVQNIGAFDAKNGISEGVVKMMEHLAKDIIPLLVQGLQPVADLIKFIGETGSEIFAKLGEVTASWGVSVQDLVGYVTSFGAAFVVLVGVPALLMLIAEGFIAVMASLGPLSWALGALSALAAYIAVNKDRLVEFHGAHARLGDFLMVYWERTTNVLKDVWQWLVNLFNGTMQFGGEVLKFFNDLPNMIAKGITDALMAVTRFMADVLGKIGVGLNLLHAGMGSGMIDAANGMVAAAEKSRGIVEGSIAKGARSILTPSEGIGKWISEQAGHAGGALGGVLKHYYGGADEQASDRSKNRKPPALHQTFDLNAKVPQEVDPNKPEEDDGKAAKEAEKRIREAEAALKSLTAAYDPLMGKAVKHAEDWKKVSDLIKLSKEHAADFAAALAASNMSKGDFDKLKFEVTHGMDATDAKKFFEEYSLGYKDTAKEAADAADKTRFFQDMVRLQNEAMTDPKAMTYYVGWLKEFGMTADTARVAYENFQNGVSKTEVDKQAGAAKTIVSRFGRKNESRDDDALKALEKLTPGTDAYTDALKQAHIEAGQLDAAIIRLHIHMGDAVPLATQAKVAMEDYFDNLQQNGIKAGAIVTNAFKGLEDTFVNFVKTGKLDFKSLIDSMIGDLARYLIQQEELAVFKQVTGGGSGGGINFATAANFAATAASFFGFHSGGTAGSTSAYKMSVDPSVFDGAKRYHTGGLAGVKDDEVPLIAKRGEALMPTMRMSDGSLGVKVQGAGGGGNMIHFNPVIQVSVGGDASKEAGDQHGQAIARQLLPAMKQMVQEELVNQTRTGGILHPKG